MADLLNSDIFMQELQDLQEFASAAMAEEILSDVKPAIETLNNIVSVIPSSDFNEQQEKEPEKSPQAEENLGQSIESPTTAEKESFHFKCIFCEQLLSAKDDPKILECLHNACGNCVKQKLYEGSVDAQTSSTHHKGFQCPICGYFMERKHLIDNQFLLEATNNDEINKLTDVKCSNCSDDALATSWCVDCAEFICDNCVQAHQRLKITKDHTIKGKEDGIINSQNNVNNAITYLLCEQHPNEKLTLFCENCDKLTCRDCQLTEHRDHKYKFTHEIAHDSRSQMQAMLKDITYKKILLNSAMQVIEDRQTLISRKKKDLVQEITNLVVRLTHTINVRGKQLVSRLNEVCDTKQKTLDEKKVALNHLSKITDHCIDFTQKVLENGSDNALLYSKRHVTCHLQRIKSRRADIPNPEVPVRINLALDRVPDLVKVISSIGQIIVDGKVFPSQSPSPNSMPPQNSPNPIQMISQQQEHAVQQPQPPPPYTQTRMLTPYGQQHQYSSSMNRNLRQTRPSCGPNQGQSQGLGPMGGIPPMALTQQLNQNMQRLPMHRPTLRPILPNLQSRIHPATGINNQQVTSSTHPQGMMQDRNNLRGLLQPNGNAVYVQTGPGQYQAVQPQYAQQFQNRFNTQPFQRPPMYQQQQQQQQTHQQQQQPPQRLQNMPLRPATRDFQTPPQQQQTQQMQLQQQRAQKWHIPQQTNENRNILSTSLTMPTLNNNFKIMLKSQQPNLLESNKSSVTSTIPKTPSPNHLQGAAETRMDKLCADSVNDLMATIAKLDSNGVQVLAENRPKTGSSPHVDSSTGDALTSGKSKNETMEIGKDDPNEDWCAVCMDGGELVCCDKCPKVFHQFCHIPNLSVEESDTWQCLLCMNFADVPDTNEEHVENELTPRQKKVAERIILELYCQYEPSLPFREIIGVENINYHEIIKNPIALDTVRHKLDWSSPNRYGSLEQLVKDVRLMFKNAYTFNAIDSQVYTDAANLEKFFDEQLEKWIPEYAYDMLEDENIQPPNKKYKRIISDD
ncbi:PREDICTED: transcription intermediary factor 1-alpha isoform X2 [Nicrophorus vespilloides]|uniref:Transcription intermediary factor 1-alpha isoform X2 n=1 Tax=Nicrophorus vespilloides TaxID=110193 RepID=A0ABM1N8N8_NICVS|nr:PREDICTED: transcription intermediary factor 1-alpha isoform X2 [Nicrophorus vespilloides]